MELFNPHSHSFSKFGTSLGWSLICSAWESSRQNWCKVFSKLESELSESFAVESSSLEFWNLPGDVLFVSKLLQMSSDCWHLDFAVILVFFFFLFFFFSFLFSGMVERSPNVGLVNSLELMGLIFSPEHYNFSKEVRLLWRVGPLQEVYLPLDLRKLSIRNFCLQPRQSIWLYSFKTGQDEMVVH